MAVASVFGGGQTAAVAREEYVGGHEGDALVAIDERVIADQARNVGGSQLSEIRAAVGEPVARAGEGGIEQSLVAQSRRAAMVGQQPVVEDEHQLAGDPNRLASSARSDYLARARNVLR